MCDAAGERCRLLLSPLEKPDQQEDHHDQRQESSSDVHAAPFGLAAYKEMARSVSGPSLLVTSLRQVVAVPGTALAVVAAEFGSVALVAVALLIELRGVLDLVLRAIDKNGLRIVINVAEASGR
jgi:hypothetical protein